MNTRIRTSGAGPVPDAAVEARAFAPYLRDGFEIRQKERRQ